MITKVYSVISWDNYYPESDNTRGLFANYEDAKDFHDAIIENDKPHYSCDHYKIVEREVM